MSGSFPLGASRTRSSTALTSIQLFLYALKFAYLLEACRRDCPATPREIMRDRAAAHPRESTDAAAAPARVADMLLEAARQKTGRARVPGKRAHLRSLGGRPEAALPQYVLALKKRGKSF